MSDEYWQDPALKEREPELVSLGRDEFPQPLPVGQRGTFGWTEKAAAATRLDRRQLLQAAAVGVAASSCTRAPVRHAVPFVEPAEELTPGEALHYATTCGACPSACGLLVKTRDGRPIKVEGNDASSLTGGGTCANGQATVLSLYDDDRLRKPRWHGEPATWAELDRHVQPRLDAIRAAGHRVVLLSGTVTSPTTQRLIDEWCRSFPEARHIAYDPLSLAALRRAHDVGFGRPVIPHHDIERADVVVGLEADFLGSWLSPVAFARGYAKRRRLSDSEPGSMSWHAQFESMLSLTGANADLRVAVKPSKIASVAVALLAEIRHLAGYGDPEPASTPDPGPAGSHVKEVATALWRHRGRSLVLCGINHLATQIVVAAINAELGNYGTTLDLSHDSRQRRGDEGELLTLLEEMRKGEIHGLVFFGTNPIYDTPFGEELRDGLKNVALSISLCTHLDETAVEVDAVCPDHHPLEAWNDAEPIAKAECQLAQPVVRPLFGTRAAQESLLKWMGKPPDFYSYLRRRWQEELYPTHSQDQDFEAFWSRSLHDGFSPAGSKGPGPTPSFTADADAAAAEISAAAIAERATHTTGTVELRLYENIALRDGRGANNPWLQELPDPVTRVAWGNYVSLSPGLAEELGVEEGDEVRLSAGERSLELPAHLQPGLASGTVAVALGYGRTHAGKVGNEIGRSAYPWIEVDNGLFRYSRIGVALERTGRREPLALSQRHHRLEGRPIVKETTLADYRADPRAGNRDRPHLSSLWSERPEADHSWGMVIDLNTCLGCSACVVACQAENNVPVVGKEEATRGRTLHWIRLDRYYRGASESPDTVFQPMLCQHCDNAPCETVCPVLATVHSSDGLNQQIYNRCVGTRYCANNCPYKVRRFNWFNYAQNKRFDYHMNSDVGRLVLNPDVVVRSRGVMEKCSMCAQRIQAARIQAKRAERSLRDGDIRTACQQACPANAITFGDLMDPASRLAQSWQSPRLYHVLEELNVRPSVGYLTKVRNRRSDGAGEEGGEHV